MGNMHPELQAYVDRGVQIIARGGRGPSTKLIAALTVDFYIHKAVQLYLCPTCNEPPGFRCTAPGKTVERRQVATHPERIAKAHLVYGMK